MKIADGYEVLESVVVEMDPVVDGFAGVLVELVFDGEHHVLTETALGSDNLLLRLRSQDPEPVYALLAAELTRAPLRLTDMTRSHSTSEISCQGCGDW